MKTYIWSNHTFGYGGNMNVVFSAHEQDIEEGNLKQAADKHRSPALTTRSRRSMLTSAQFCSANEVETMFGCTSSKCFFQVIEWELLAPRDELFDA